MKIDRDKLDAMPFYVALIDSRHRIHFANKAVREVLEAPLETLVGAYCPRVMHGLDTPYAGCPLEDALAGNGYEREHYDEDFQKWYLLSAYPTGNLTESGDEIFFHTVQDITEKKKFELACADGWRDNGSYRDAKKFFLVATMNGGLVELSEYGLDLFGIDQEAMRSQKNICHALGIDSEDWNRITFDLSENGFIHDFMIKARRADRTPVPIVINAALDRSRYQNKTALIRATAQVQ